MPANEKRVNERNSDVIGQKKGIDSGKCKMTPQYVNISENKLFFILEASLTWPFKLYILLKVKQNSFHLSWKARKPYLTMDTSSPPDV